MSMKLAKEQMPDIGDKIETPDGLRKSSWYEYFRTSITD